MTSPKLNEQSLNSQRVEAKRHLVLLGCGKMGSAMLKGWLEHPEYFKHISIIEPAGLSPEFPLSGLISCYSSIDELLKYNSTPIDIVVLAVKPQMMSDAIAPFRQVSLNNIVFLSIAAGLSFSWFKKSIYENIKIVRAMPNLPASVGKSITGYCKSSNLSENDEENTIILLNSFGKAVHLESENLIDVVTAISGSGPAYIFYFVEVLCEIGKNQGLSEDSAKMLALETLIGSSKLLEISNIEPKTLRQNVTSPGGTTEAGLKTLASSKNGLFDLLNSTISAAKQRAIELNSND